MTGSAENPGVAPSGGLPSLLSWATLRRIGKAIRPSTSAPSAEATHGDVEVPSPSAAVHGEAQTRERKMLPNLSSGEQHCGRVRSYLRGEHVPYPVAKPSDSLSAKAKRVTDIGELAFPTLSLRGHICAFGPLYHKTSRQVSTLSHCFTRCLGS